MRGMLIALVATLCAAVPSAAAGQVRDQVRILVPVFSGDARLGATTANLVRLQISRTFQVAGTDTRAVMVFEERQLGIRSQEGAIAAGLRPGSLAHLVLWGQSYPYPDGAAIETYLSITPWLYEGRRERPELWKIDLPGAQPIQIRAELPREIYQFPPIVLSAEAAAHYKSMDSLVIYRDRSFTHPIGRFRDIFRAHRYEDGAVLMESGGVRGWVPLPYLLSDGSEVVDFVGGYIRILRGDWSGAEQLLRGVAEAPSASPEMRIDANIFLGLCAEMRQQSGLRYFEAAAAENRYDRSAAIYLLMGRIAQAMRLAGGSRAEEIARLRRDLAANAFMFTEGNAWLAEVRRAADRLGSAG